MLFNSFLVYFLIFVFSVFFYFTLVKRIGLRPKDFPPGPPTLPIIGNLHQMPRKPEENGPQFEKWARQYGPVYSLILGTQVWVVLCKDSAVKELLEKRGAIYSSRPDAFLVQDVLSGGLRAFFLKGGAAFKRNRRLGRVHLSEKASRTYVPYQELENKAMLFGILEKPHLYLDHIKQFTSSLTMQMIFGIRVLGEDDPLPKKLFGVSVSGVMHALLQLG